MGRSLALVFFAAALVVGSSHCGSSNPASSPDVDASVDGGGAVEAGPLDATMSDAGMNPKPEGGPTPDTGAPDTGTPPVSCPLPPFDAGVPTLTITAGPGAAPGGGTTIALDGTGTGRVFDGIGAISGGGGNSRLFFDYPEPYRSQLLDYLFKPGYGAALHILKVEIGGDMNSTDGSEASHMHTRTDLGCNRGYEWWLMQEAKARNPDIKLYGLAWGAPGWVGGGNFWSQDMVEYLMKWLGCAKSNGFTIDYLGGWNERSYDKTWYENLHAALATNGYTAKVVGADDSWDVATDMSTDSTFKAAVDIVGVHYPCGGDGAPATSCPAFPAALGLGVPLWASENGSQDLNSGAPAMIRAILRGYIDAKMTAYINWPIVAAIPPGLPWETMGLVQANQPWSGWYEVGAQTWMAAQVTQFTQPGWSFVDSASGYFGGNNANGAYVMLKAPSGGDYSVLVETTTATQPQTVSFTTTGGLSSGAVHVWATDLGSGRASDQFVHAADVTPSGGAFWVTLPPNTVVSISTTSGQGKGTATSPPRDAALLPYAESFEGYAVGTLAPYIADQSGAFDVEACGGGRAGQCLRQMSPVAPIAWNDAGEAYNTLGSNEWADYSVAADVLLEQPGSAELIGRYSARDYNYISRIDAYLLSVKDTGAWAIVKADVSGAQTVLSSGTVTALGTGTWHRLQLDMNGTAIKATIDGTIVGQATDATYSSGSAGLGVGMVSTAWLNAQFDNLSIMPLAALATPYTDTIVNRASGLALDVAGASTAQGAQLQQSAADGGASQRWQIAGDRSGYSVLLNANSLKAVEGLPSPGIDQAAADSGAAQHWSIEPTGDSFYRLVNPSGLAVAAADGGGVVLAPLDCASGAQEWAFSASPVANASYVIINHKTGWLVDVSAASSATGAVVLQWPPNGENNQSWTLRPAAGGAYTLLNGNSNLALDANNGVADQATPAGTPAETWTLKPASAGYYTLVSGAGGVLGSPSSVQGAQLVVMAGNGTASQEWSLAAAP